MTERKDILQNGSVVALLAGLWRGIKSELDAAAHELAPDLRPSHVRLLSLTPRDGMRVGDLAARAGMTAQSLGEFVDTLCRTGYARVVPDASDRRARLVVPTERGRDVAHAMNTLVHELEDRWRQEIGGRDWELFRGVLIKLHSPARAITSQ
ncbi:MAG TPA: MarR family transcriptional regulator [Nakamurella sp.]|jgi:DNA-binding MarR family transcriptional regulator